MRAIAVHGGSWAYADSGQVGIARRDIDNDSSHTSGSVASKNNHTLSLQRKSV